MEIELLVCRVIAGDSKRDVEGCWRCMMRYLRRLELLLAFGAGVLVAAAAAGPQSWPPAAEIVQPLAQLFVGLLLRC